nr:uncharacterized protein LOC127328956 [Lolium perenne]
MNGSRRSLEGGRGPASCGGWRSGRWRSPQNGGVHGKAAALFVFFGGGGFGNPFVTTADHPDALESSVPAPWSHRIWRSPPRSPPPLRPWLPWPSQPLAGPVAAVASLQQPALPPPLFPWPSQPLAGPVAEPAAFFPAGTLQATAAAAAATNAAAAATVLTDAVPAVRWAAATAAAAAVATNTAAAAAAATDAVPAFRRCGSDLGPGLYTDTARDALPPGPFPSVAVTASGLDRYPPRVGGGEAAGCCARPPSASACAGDA